jgi:hypothetical protein
MVKLVRSGRSRVQWLVPNWLTLRLNKVDLSLIPPATLLVLLCLMGLTRFRNKLTPPNP